MSESKLLKSVVSFVIAGAVISMFDRKTREHTIETTKKVKDRVVYYAKNRDELKQAIEQKVEAAQKIYVNASENINTIVSKIEEVKEIPENVQNIVKETKSELNKPEKF
ncbi:YtxH domain-containing protein [Lysinibacillus fusiformis]|nr:YtxH domain-containing protein [Lysinibacillus fusiformis]